MSNLFSATGPASATGGIASGTTPGASTAVAALVNPPPTLTQLAVGSLITGLVSGRDGHGIVQIKTDHGTVGLNTRLPLEAGSRVTLQLQVAGARMQVILLAIDGRPVTAASTGGAPTNSALPGTPAATPTAGPGQPGRPGQPGQPAAGTTTPPVSARAENAATNGTGRPGAAAHGSNRTGPANPLAPGRTLFGHLTAPAGAPAGTPTGAAATQTPSQRLLLRVVSLEMPHSGIGPPRPALMAAHSPGDVTTLTATATGADTNGNPIVKTPLGMITLAAKARLPAGAVLLLEVLNSETPPETATLPANDRQRVLGSLAREWPTLNEALDAVKVTDPGTARLLIDRALPQPGPRLVLDFFAYVAGLRNGKPESWLGAAVAKALAQAGRPELAPQLAEEFGQIARLAADQPAGEWRTFLIPLYHGERLHQLRMFLRRDRRGDGDAGAEDGSARFVVEFELSALGEFQIDGLSRGKRLDIILRSRSPLPGDMRRDLTTIYARSCEATGMAGEITFQKAPAFAVTPLEDIAKSDAGFVV